MSDGVPCLDKAVLAQGGRGCFQDSPVTVQTIAVLCSTEENGKIVWNKVVRMAFDDS